MLATEDPSQQQLHFLQSCGFGGLWRFAGPFTKTSVCILFCWKNQTCLESESKMDFVWFFISVQFDGRIVGAVRELSGSDG